MSSSHIPSQEGNRSILDDTIQRMLSERPDCTHPDYEIHDHAIRDLLRLESLGPETYTGDVRVFVRFPGDYTNPSTEGSGTDDGGTDDLLPLSPSSWRSSQSSSPSPSTPPPLPPSPSPEVPYVSCNGRVWRTKEFRADSAKLLQTGSKVFAELLLSPDKQARMRRQLGIPPKPEPEPGSESGSGTPELVLDLTPPAEGEELATQLSKLSVPRDVAAWWMSMERLHVSRYLVSGHDDNCPRHGEVDLWCPRRPGYVSHAPRDDGGGVFNAEVLDLADVMPSEARDIVDYCPIRHRANILRLLLAIQGEELVLDSAPRVFTLVGIAKILDCTNVVRDPVFTWLMTPPNTQFVELHPEAALRLAWTLRLQDVARAALSVLAAERAIKRLGTLRHHIHHSITAATLFGRPCLGDQDLPEEMEEAVARAAQSLIGRARLTCERLFSVGIGGTVVGGDSRRHEREGQPDVFDWLGVGEWGVLRQIGAWSEGCDAGLRTEAMRLVAAVATELRARVEKALVLACNVYPAGQQYGEYDEARRCAAPRDGLPSTALVYAGLSPAQRLLTPVFWNQLTALLGDGISTWVPHMHLAEAHLARDVWDLNNLLLIESQQRTSSVDSVSAPTKIATISRSASVSACAAQNAQGEAAAKPMSPWRQREPLQFSLSNFNRELGTAIRGLAAQWTSRNTEVSITRTDHLNLCLTEYEFGFLPRWDGSHGQEDDGNAI